MLLEKAGWLILKQEGVLDVHLMATYTVLC